MSLSMDDIKLIANNIFKKEEVSDINIFIDNNPSQCATSFKKSTNTLHINKRALSMAALTYGIKEEVVLTIRMYLEIAHINNCQVPTYNRYEQLLKLKENGEISIDELIEYNKIIKDIKDLAWDYCENRVKAEYADHIDDCKRLRTVSLGKV
ncbi:hypothetical protein [Clostridium thailandense]|uniref:Uncharacterized protein n=1 Tax=Clostridium thailandense TaxID=2794346 RepID=A0A949WQF3_9CLOT|nr:hypothetical protein [Clostridium thailandense]MBV7272691.1 hypothetical protein [Clostridium thailandense]MCH5137860.1 hypothetical protein [Clostridiaceae bacterium UIB06]